MSDPRRSNQAPVETERSLFGEILDWMLAPLLLLWPMSIAITYLVAQDIAGAPFDRQLSQSVEVLSDHVKEFRGGYRKIALLEKYDAKLQCGQCHVEYNCNPGFDPKTGEYTMEKAPCYHLVADGE